MRAFVGTAVRKWERLLIVSVSPEKRTICRVHHNSYFRNPLYPTRYTFIMRSSLLMLLLALRVAPLSAFTVGGLGDGSSVTTSTLSRPTRTSTLQPRICSRPPLLQLTDSYLTEPNNVEEEGSNKEEYTGLVLWMATLSAFLLTNQFVGPWPEGFILDVPQRTFLLIHFLSGMLFGGGIILTTCIEWLVVGSSSSSRHNKDALLFWFQRVPQLDAFLVVPALTSAVVSGVALSVQNYERLSFAPLHIRMALYTLVLFALWWATTDVTTQAPARTALEAWATGPSQEDADENNKVNDEAVPRVVQLRRISNVVSCLLVVLLYAIMTLKPGYP